MLPDTWEKVSAKRKLALQKWNEWLNFHTWLRYINKTYLPIVFEKRKWDWNINYIWKSWQLNMLSDRERFWKQGSLYILDLAHMTIIKRIHRNYKNYSPWLKTMHIARTLHCITRWQFNLYTPKTLINATLIRVASIFAAQIFADFVHTRRNKWRQKFQKNFFQSSIQTNILQHALGKTGDTEERLKSRHLNIMKKWLLSTIIEQL